MGQGGKARDWLNRRPLGRMDSMEALRISASEMSDPQERLGLISSMISETFCSSWTAEPIGGPDPHASMKFAHAPGVALSHAHMSPLTLANAKGAASSKRKYYAYVANQPQVIRIESGGSIYVPPQEFMILSSDTPCEIVTNRSYTTSSLVIDSDLFMEHVPTNYQGLIARRLAYP